MAKTAVMLADAVTGFTAIGTLTSFKRKTSAEAKYAKAATGAPDKSNVVAGPKTMSAELEISGTIPVAGTGEITVASQVYHTTSVEESWTNDGEFSTVSIEGSEKI
jgi:hypothetical protein